MNLQAGQKTTLASLMGPSLQFEVRVTLVAPFDIDVTAFGLNRNEKLFSDDYMIYFNQPVSPNNAVVLSKSGQTTRFKFDLSRHNLTAVEKFVICASVDSPNHTMSEIRSGNVEIIANGNVVASFPISRTHFLLEKAVMLGQVYFKNEWRFGAIAQGFNGGLKALVEHFGGEVEPEPPKTTPQQTPVPTPVKPAATPNPVQSAPSNINLSKIKLDKNNPTISLTKKASGFGRIGINLNWNQTSPSLVKSFFNRNQAVDLDLCALIKFKDGSKYAIQALGKRFGDFDRYPFVFLDGDDRAGSISQGENLYINGDKWDNIERVLVFAAIYEGVASWSDTDGVINIKIPNQPELEVRLADNSNANLCAIIELHNQAGTIKANREVRYFHDIGDMDRHYGYGFRIVNGSKK
ncbi:TerD family protein [Acinetobacter indicus]|uniref:TerD family protein n=1 Tax=Acinetobacter indicus TaxID=756892 RepID=UPI00148F2138|nr:TerD family protein [Acinetobacter indicus]